MRPPIALALSCIALSACTEGQAPEDADFRIFGPTTTNVNAVGTGFEAAVGRLFLPGGNCTATAVTRTSIVTAAHCLCGGTAGATFCLPQGSGGDACVTLADGGEGFTSGVTSFVTHPGTANVCNYVTVTPQGLVPDDESVYGPDVAVGFLASSIPVGVLPELPRVYLGPTPLQFGVTQSVADGGLPTYFQVGFGSTTWTGVTNTGPRRRGEAGTDLHWESSGGVYDAWFLESDANDDPAALSTHGQGDSGGPLFMQPMDGNQRVGDPWLVGVISGASEVSWDDDQQWSTVGSRAQQLDGVGILRNSDIVAQALAPDVDQDGVLDFSDNCPPQACSNPSLCANENQADSDSDGAGDVCDRCDDVDDAPGFGQLGPDGDEDGVGDVCDNCPEDPNGWQADTDEDGVGDACDTCLEVDNAYAECTPSTQCPGGGWCLLPLNQPPGMETGHCSRQADDSDGDGLGLACDPCRHNPADGDHELFANSNLDAEDDEGVGHLGDVCDPVPQYVARPVPVAFEDQGDTCTIGDVDLTCRDAVMFLASSTLGSTTGAFKQHAAPVGFRHCDCYDASETLLDRETCMATQCAVLPADYSDPSSPWVRVSIGVEGGPFPAYPAELDDPTFASRTFTSDVTHAGSYGHPDDGVEGDAEHEAWRVGPTEAIVWPWMHDVTEGHVVGHPELAPVETRKTGGILWSLASIGDDGDASRRDGQVDHRLRSVYAYLVTPLVAPPEPLGPMEWEPALECFGADCYQWLRPGLERINPPDYELLDWMDEPMFVHEAGGELLVSGGKDLPAVYAQDHVSSFLHAQMLAEDSYWLSPVEPESTTRRLALPGQGAFLPHEWTKDSQVHLLQFENGRLVEDLVENAGLLLPSARTEYTALLSASERSLFMVGGRNEWGDPTQDIWRFDLETAEWEHEAVDGIGIQYVADVAYAPNDRRMLVVDRHTLGELPVGRIVLVDFAENRASVLAQLTDEHRFERIVVAAETNGSFVLLLSDSDEKKTVGYRFSVDKEGLQWLGEGVLDGTLLDGAQLTDGGVMVPMNLAGAQVVPVLGVDDLGGITKGPEAF